MPRPRRPVRLERARRAKAAWPTVTERDAGRQLRFRYAFRHQSGQTTAGRATALRPCSAHCCADYHRTGVCTASSQAEQGGVLTW